jgi:hypothetical protein
VASPISLSTLKELFAHYLGAGSEVIGLRPTHRRGIPAPSRQLLPFNAGRAPAWSGRGWNAGGLNVCYRSPERFLPWRPFASGGTGRARKRVARCGRLHRRHIEAGRRWPLQSLPKRLAIGTSCVNNHEISVDSRHRHFNQCRVPASASIAGHIRAVCEVILIYHAVALPNLRLRVLGNDDDRSGIHAHGS